jgi:hypothetical protein
MISFSLVATSSSWMSPLTMSPPRANTMPGYFGFTMWLLSRSMARSMSAFARPRAIFEVVLVHAVDLLRVDDLAPVPVGGEERRHAGSPPRPRMKSSSLGKRTLVLTRPCTFRAFSSGGERLAGGLGTAAWTASRNDSTKSLRPLDPVVRVLRASVLGAPHLEHPAR